MANKDDRQIRLPKMAAEEFRAFFIIAVLMTMVKIIMKMKNIVGNGRLSEVLYCDYFSITSHLVAQFKSSCYRNRVNIILNMEKFESNYSSIPYSCTNHIETS